MIFSESLDYFIELFVVNGNLELFVSILSKCFRCSNESNQKAIRDHSSKSEIIFIFWGIFLEAKKGLLNPLHTEEIRVRGG